MNASKVVEEVEEDTFQKIPTAILKTIEINVLMKKIQRSLYIGIGAKDVIYRLKWKRKLKGEMPR